MPEQKAKNNFGFVCRAKKVDIMSKVQFKALCFCIKESTNVHFQPKNLSAEFPRLGLLFQVLTLNREIQTGRAPGDSSVSVAAPRTKEVGRVSKGTAPRFFSEVI